jgi:hypothetical protein
VAKLSEAKRDFQNGLIVNSMIQRFADFWVVEFSYSGKLTGEALVDARTSKPRHFKTVDAAVRAIEDVGLSVDSLRLR